MSALKLSDSELQAAAQACRVAQRQAENDASKQSSPSVRRMFDASAQSFAALSAKLEAARKSGQTRQISK